MTASSVWLFHPKCRTIGEIRRGEFRGKALKFRPADSMAEADVPVVPTEATRLEACCEEFLRMLTNEQ